MMPGSYQDHQWRNAWEARQILLHCALYCSYSKMHSLAGHEAEQGRKAQGKVLNASGIDPSEEKLPQVRLEAIFNASFPEPLNSLVFHWDTKQPAVV